MVPKHTLRACEAWREERQRLVHVIGSDLGLASVVQAMLGSREAWAEMISFSSKVMLERKGERGLGNWEVDLFHCPT